MLDFRMETFLTVCEYMNFTHAAEKLNLTQPAVSQHIKYLKKNRFQNPDRQARRDRTVVRGTAAVIGKRIRFTLIYP